MSPRVTVVIATFGWPEVLPFAISGVLEQTFADFELLVIGDGCTNETESVVRSFEERDRRLRWINLPKNTKHQSGPNNEAIRVARGTHLAYCGHDDVWLPHHLETLVAAIDRGADVAHSLAAGIGVGFPPFLCPAHPLPYDVWQWIPPLVMLQSVALLREIGGWRTPWDLVTEMPEADVNRRLAAAGATTEVVLRLTAIKIPADARPGVYVERPSHEQSHWLEQARLRPNLEAELLAEIVTHRRIPSPPTRRDAVKAGLRALRGPLPNTPTVNKPGWMDEMRRKKGLE